jgi:hypothetical protein
MLVGVVIARYNESLRWLIQSGIVHRNVWIYVYNKGVADLHYLRNYCNIVVVPLENVGREGHTYYTHIVRHYTSLSEFTLFLQGDPFPHATNAIERVFQCIDGAIHAQRQPGPLSRSVVFQPIGDRVMRTHTIDTRDHRGLPLREIVRFLFGVDYVGYIPFVAGAQFMVHLSAVHSREKDFYASVVELLSISIDPLEGYAIERLHQPIFNLCAFKKQ